MMRRRAILFVAAVALATLFVLLVVRPTDDSSRSPADSPVLAPPDESPQTDEPSSAGGQAVADDPDDSIEPAGASTTDRVQAAPAASGPYPPVPDDALRVVVTHLADGDSFDVEWIDPPPSSVWRDEIRLRGINAPEGDACFGPEARSVLAELVLSGPVRFVLAADERDDFGRAIGDVWTDDGTHVNRAMVEAGAALALSGDGPFADEIAIAQELANAAGRGLWTSCGADADLAIVDLLADAPGRDDLNPNGEWIEIANLGAAPVDLTGWGIRDESTRHRFFFPDGFVLGPDERVRIGSGCDFDDGADAVDLFWCGEDPVWNNGGDTAFLVDDRGRFVDEWP